MRYWCLGNEMDGPWQIGHMQAREYGRKARDAARQMRVIDRELQLIACGSSGTEHADLPGLGPRSAGGVLRPGGRHLAARLLRQHASPDRQQHRALSGDESRHGSPDSRDRRGVRLRPGACADRASGSGCRSTSGTSGTARAAATATDGRRTAAPKLLEEVYNLEDALLVGGFVNTLLRNADRVRVGCLAQLVNVIAPLVTERCRRAAAEHLLPVRVGACSTRAAGCSTCGWNRRPIRSPPQGCRPTSRRNDQVPFVDVVATHDPQNGQACVLMLNRDLDGERELQLEWRDATPTRVLACETLTGPDLKAFNTFEQPRRVRPERLDAPAPGARMTFKLPARSYTVAHLAITAHA